MRWSSEKRLMLPSHPVPYLLHSSHHLSLNSQHFSGKKYLNKTCEAEEHTLKNIGMLLANKTPERQKYSFLIQY